MHIIPAINAKDFAGVQSGLDRIHQELLPNHSEVDFVHIDVADGSFTNVVLWHNPHNLRDIRTPLKVEIHLMVDPVNDNVLKPWLEAPVRRLIFHLETCKDASALQGQAGDIELIPAFVVSEKLDIPSDAYNASMIQLLAVRPGQSGQEMHSTTPPCVQKIHQHSPNMMIEVDGGVNMGTINALAKAGATHVVAASALFQSSNMAIAYEKLKNEIRNT